MIGYRIASDYLRKIKKIGPLRSDQIFSRQLKGVCADMRISHFKYDIPKNFKQTPKYFRKGDMSHKLLIPVTLRSVDSLTLLGWVLDPLLL